MPHGTKLFSWISGQNILWLVAIKILNNDLSKQIKILSKDVLIYIINMGSGPDPLKTEMKAIKAKFYCHEKKSNYLERELMCENRE